MRKRKASTYFMILIILLILSSCQSNSEAKNPLDPSNPISVTLWHYYSGQTKEKFDQLVAEFNQTVGVEKGIVIDAQSQGDVKQLETAVFEAANKKIGSQHMPHIFASYPDNAYRINQIVELVDIETYFSKDEIQQFREEFLEEGRFGSDNKLKIVPIAKSTENLFLNITFWDLFASETGAKLEQLSTWQGVLEVAEEYYEWSGGKAFLSIDSNSNYMLISAMQLDEEIYNYGGDNVKLNFKEEVAKTIWDHYYVPYIKGWFLKTGRFSSDDAKIGKVLAYTGSTAGAAYFPKEVTLSQNDVYPIECMTLPYPYFEQGSPFAAQQGAGMVITKSDLAHEYAATQFLKWFTNTKQNLEFATSTGYFPVKVEALDDEIILSLIEEKKIETSESIVSTIKTTVEMLDEYQLYGYKPFDGSIDMRQILENHLFTKVHKDIELLSLIKSEEEKNQKVADLISETNFRSWYDDFLLDARSYFE